MKFGGAEGNIPDLPFIIVVPVNLHTQWTHEIHKFLRRGYFDVLPYIGTLATRPNFWEEQGSWNHSIIPLHRRILLCSITVYFSFPELLHAD